MIIALTYIVVGLLASMYIVNIVNKEPEFADLSDPGFTRFLFAIGILIAPITLILAVILFVVRLFE